MRRPSSRLIVLFVSALVLAGSAAAVARQQPKRANPGQTTVRPPMVAPAAPKRDLNKPMPKPASPPSTTPAPDPKKPPVAPIVPEVPSPPDVQLPIDPGAEDAIKPLPLVAIPDDPPPHEGAMITIPYVIRPPDIIHVEVLQALPGRPIGGERLVRPDGTISLDFYGDVDVAGLNKSQVKEKVVHHLRKFLRDEVLGLYEEEDEIGTPRRDARGEIITIPPSEVHNVFVDVASYNSATYFVQGDVAVPGRFPWTGNETVLDAFNYAGGYAPTSEESDFHLVRPARGGKPAKVYTIDMAAIRDRGESDTNYQLFPGDRLVIGRNPVVKANVALNRLSEGARIVIHDIHFYAQMTKALTTANGGVPMTAAQREAFLKDWLDSWVKNALAPGGPKLDEKALRELMLRQIDDAPAAPPAPEAPVPK